MHERLENKNNDEEALFAELLALAPNHVKAFVPDNAQEQKEAFMNGSIDTPQHTYGRLLAKDLDTQRFKLVTLKENFVKLPDIEDSDRQGYELFVDSCLSHNFFQSLIKEYHMEPANRKTLAEEIKNLGGEIWANSDQSVYRSLLNEKMNRINDVDFSNDELMKIKSELVDLVPTTDQNIFARFIPSQDTINHTKAVAEALFGGMIAHIPQDIEKFSPEDIATVFREIIRDEFGEAGSEWGVDVVAATSITVSAQEKIIRIPENRKPVDYTTLRGLVAHELGVHMLRSVMGGETKTNLLSIGLSDYGDSEEGLGKVMEQAINGKYQDSGIPYYLIVGMAQHDNFNFRQCYEVLWRLKLLESSDGYTSVSPENKSILQEGAYKSVFRIFRGTDTIPWTKDLAYYRGSEKIWQFYEDAAGDDLLITMGFMGKADLANSDHKRVLLESRSH